MTTIDLQVKENESLIRSDVSYLLSSKIINKSLTLKEFNNILLSVQYGRDLTSNTFDNNQIPSPIPKKYILEYILDNKDKITIPSDFDWNYWREGYNIETFSPRYTSVNNVQQKATHNPSNISLDRYDNEMKNFIDERKKTIDKSQEFLDSINNKPQFYISDSLKKYLEQDTDYLTEYPSSTNLYITFNDNKEVDEINFIEFNVITNDRPIYGYSSQKFDAVARGNIIVQGTFAINYVYEGYLVKKYSKIDDVEFEEVVEDEGDDIANISEKEEIEVNKKKFWNNNNEGKITPINTLFNRNTTNKNNISNLKIKIQNKIFINDKFLTTEKIISDVQISQMGFRSIIDGEPLQEIYQFFGRDYGKETSTEQNKPDVKKSQAPQPTTISVGSTFIQNIDFSQMFTENPTYNIKIENGKLNFESTKNEEGLILNPYPDPNGKQWIIGYGTIIDNKKPMDYQYKPGDDVTSFGVTVKLDANGKISAENALKMLGNAMSRINIDYSTVLEGTSENQRLSCLDYLYNVANKWDRNDKRIYNYISQPNPQNAQLVCKALTALLINGEISNGLKSRTIKRIDLFFKDERDPNILKEINKYKNFLNTLRIEDNKISPLINWDQYQELK